MLISGVTGWNPSVPEDTLIHLHPANIGNRGKKQGTNTLSLIYHRYVLQPDPSFRFRLHHRPCVSKW